MKNKLFQLSVFSLTLLLCLIFSRQDIIADIGMNAADSLDLDKIPQLVMDGLKAKFPKAEIQKWTQEEEGDIIVYDFEFIQEGRKFEADIKEDGSIHNWEKAIEKENLPEVVLSVVEYDYSNLIINEIMEITAVIDGEDVLEGYEIVLETPDQKIMEVTLAPDGSILEDSEQDEE